MVNVEETGESSADGGAGRRPKRATVKLTDFRALAEGKPQPAQILGKRATETLDSALDAPASRRQRRQPPPQPRRRGGASVTNQGSTTQPRLNTSVDTNFTRPPVFGGGESSRAGEGGGAGASADAQAAVRDSLTRIEAQLNRTHGSVGDLTARQAEQTARLNGIDASIRDLNTRQAEQGVRLDSLIEQNPAMNDRLAAMEARLELMQHAPPPANNPAAAAAAVQPPVQMVRVSYFDTNRPVNEALREILRIKIDDRTPEQTRLVDKAFKECFVKPIGGGQYVVPMGTIVTDMGDIIDGDLTRMAKVPERHIAEERIYYWVPSTKYDKSDAAGVPGLRLEGRTGSDWDNDAMKTIAQLHVAEAGMDVGPCARWLQVDVETGKVMAPAAGKSDQELPMIKLPEPRETPANRNGRGGLGL